MQKQIFENDVLVSRKTLAEKLGIAIRTVDRWRQAGLIREVYVGQKRVMIESNSVLSFLSQSAKQRSAAH